MHPYHMTGLFPAFRISASRLTRLFLVALLLHCVAGCEKALDLKSPPSSATAIFQECWTTMDQRYSLFSVKGVDWNKTYQEYEPKINNSMSDKALFDVLGDMLSTLKDGHVSLIAPSDTSTYEGFYQGYPVNFNYTNIINNYLKNDYHRIGPVIFKVVSSVGYIYYSSFDNDITGAQADSVLAQMSQTKGIIIDVRNNFGGNSANVDRLFSRFVPAKRLVKYELGKKGPGHDDFSEPQPHYISPGGQPYKNPVVVLTNRSCFSACNDFVLYMSGLSNVKLMGDQTGGGGAFPHDYLLANGWTLQYSATKTLSPEKVSVENGIQPTVNIVISALDDFYGKDPILESAFQSLQ